MQTPKELVFADLFEESGIEYITVANKKPIASEIIEVVNGLKDKMLYLSGPEAMIEALDKQFIDLGIPKTQIVTDYFPGYLVL